MPRQLPAGAIIMKNRCEVSLTLLALCTFSLFSSIAILSQLSIVCIIYFKDIPIFVHISMFSLIFLCKTHKGRLPQPAFHSNHFLHSNGNYSSGRHRTSKHAFYFIEDRGHHLFGDPVLTQIKPVLHRFSGNSLNLLNNGFRIKVQFRKI